MDVDGEIENDCDRDFDDESVGQLPGAGRAQLPAPLTKGAMKRANRATNKARGNTRKRGGEDMACVCQGRGYKNRLLWTIE